MHTTAHIGVAPDDPFYAGDVATLRYTVEDVENVLGWTWEWLAAPFALIGFNAPPLLVKTDDDIDTSEAIDKRVSVTLHAEDSEGLAGEFLTQLRATDATGATRVVATGIWKIRPRLRPAA